MQMTTMITMAMDTETMMMGFSCWSAWAKENGQSLLMDIVILWLLQMLGLNSSAVNFRASFPVEIMQMHSIVLPTSVTIS